MADIFTAVDARYFAADEGTDLFVVSLASAGIDPDIFSDEYDSQSYFGRYDKSVSSIYTELGIDFLSITTPGSYYTGYANNLDRVYFDQTSPSDPVTSILTGFLPNDSLVFNTNFSAVVNNLPNISNDAVDYGSWLTLEPDNGFGAHHNSLIYLRNMDAACQSSLLPYYTNQKLLFGVGNYGYDHQWLNDPVPSVDDSGSRSLTGSDAKEFIFGLEGNDSCLGNGGIDLIDAGSGNDTLKGGAGKDFMDGGSGIDTADYCDKTSAVSVTLNAATAASVSVGGVVEDSIRNIENLIGGSAADTFNGDSLANVFKGGAGKDVLNGNGGIDTADYSDKTSAISVTLNGATAASVSVGGVVEDSIRNIENLIGGSAADTFNGDSLANVLNGGSGNDNLSGGNGDDTLVGGLGKDTLTGGTGNDIFDFNTQTEMGTTSTTGDFISDFVRGQDRIDLSTLDANNATSTNDVFDSLTVGGTFSGAFASAGDLYFDNVFKVLYGNTDDDSTAEFAIVLTSVTTLSSADFIL